ncbi:MAG: diguanylate cyclase [Sneathiellaceae bacterium]
MTSKMDDPDFNPTRLLQQLGLAAPEPPPAPPVDGAPPAEAQQLRTGWADIGQLAGTQDPAGRRQMLRSLLADAEGGIDPQAVKRFLLQLGAGIADAHPQHGLPSGEGGAAPGSGDSAGSARPMRPGSDGDGHAASLPGSPFQAWFSQIDGLVRVDGLTGLANGAELDRRLPLAWAEAAHRREALALIKIDVDCFKAFAGRYGDQAAQECLRAIGQAIDAVLPQMRDLAAHCGGAEFLVLLPAADASRACQVARGIRRAVRHAAIRHQDGVGDGFVTVSMGIVVATPPLHLHPEDYAQGVENALCAADNALYAAQRGGREEEVLYDLRDSWI